MLCTIPVQCSDCAFHRCFAGACNLVSAWMGGKHLVHEHGDDVVKASLSHRSKFLHI